AHDGAQGAGFSAASSFPLRRSRKNPARQGGSDEYLRNNLERRILTAVLQGEALARAYANVDVFLFPSKTDTFGNVVLEAMASGVLALVTNEGGPQYIVRPGETGYICRSTAEFVEQLLW